MRQTRSDWGAMQEQAAAPTCELDDQDRLGNAEVLSRSPVGECDTGPADTGSDTDAVCYDDRFGGDGTLGDVLEWMGIADADPTLEERRDLTRRYGKEVAEVWYQQMADYAWQRHSGWVRLLGGLEKLKLQLGGATKALTAIDALLATSPTDPPADVIRAWADVLDAIGGLCGVPPLAAFLGAYAIALEMVASQLDGIMKSLRHTDDEMPGFVAFPGAYTGGPLVYAYLNLVSRTRQVQPVTGDVATWATRNKAPLTFWAGEEPPVTQRTRLGLDLLAKDEVDEEALATWFLDHIDQVLLFAYDGRYQLGEDE